MSNHSFLSTTIPYVNARPHIGFALELVQADTAARYRRLKGEKIIFQTGTDENSLKNVLAAREKGVSVSEHVETLANSFQELCSELHLAHDIFLRTSSVEHHRSVQSFWSRIKPQDLYKKKYSGLYCIGCEDFVHATDLKDGLCVDHAKPPELLEEENYFFRLSHYQDEIQRLIDSNKIRITPAYRKQEILNFISSGLQDISVSRNTARSGGWGITVPGDETQTIYVWIDALINYITGPQQEAAAADWNSFVLRTHFIGKNVWKFHAIYWPALLLSAGFALPEEIVIHGFLTLKGKKISKSLGNTIDPLEVANEVGADSLRFHLLRAFSPFDDGDFSLTALKESHNAFLVNGLGNLVSRLTTLAARAGIDECSTALKSSIRPDLDEALLESRFDEGLKILWRDIDRINAEIARERPWEIIKSNPSHSTQRILEWLKDLRETNYWLSAYLPATARKIEERLKHPGSSRDHLFIRIASEATTRA